MHKGNKASFGGFYARIEYHCGGTPQYHFCRQVKTSRCAVGISHEKAKKCYAQNKGVIFVPESVPRDKKKIAKRIVLLALVESSKNKFFKRQICAFRSNTDQNLRTTRKEWS